MFSVAEWDPKRCPELCQIMVLTVSVHGIISNGALGNAFFFVVQTKLTTSTKFSPYAQKFKLPKSNSFLAQRAEGETKAAAQTEGHEEGIGSRVRMIVPHVYGFLLRPPPPDKTRQTPTLSLVILNRLLIHKYT